MMNKKTIVYSLIGALTNLSDADTVTEDAANKAINNIREKILKGEYKDFLSIEEFDEISKEYLHETLIQPESGIILRFDEKQKDWYTERDKTNDIHWFHYRKMLHEKQFSISSINVLGDALNEIMDSCVDPKGIYSTPQLSRGLVIGDVQSGKTSAYTGIIAKAFDAGYNICVVLSGVTEDLRGQTQKRIDEGILGFDTSGTRVDSKIGVGKYLTHKNDITNYTSVKSDFTIPKVDNALYMNEDCQILLVVKKNQAILNNVNNWLDKQCNIKEKNLSIMVIDDEADYASINTKTKDDPTKINKLIRQLCNLCKKSTYIGFTATPFANVFCDPTVDENNIAGADLFPENFIAVLPPAPIDYVGAKDYFYHSDKTGTPELEYAITCIADAGTHEDDGFPFYTIHSPNWDGKLPDSLNDAIATFMIATTILDLKDDAPYHRCMMINISRFINVQHRVKAIVSNIVQEYITAIEYDLDVSDPYNLINPKLKHLYNMYKLHYSTYFSWEEIVSALYNAVESLKVLVINSKKSESDKLVFSNKTPTRAIIIGGLTLSRGLTIEGLIVSYFLRNTVMYDTLMQMARWFGYKKGYKDLCRIWMPEKTRMFYQEITSASEELKEALCDMNNRGLTPKEYGIRVHKKSKELIPTSKNKMKHTFAMRDRTNYFGSVISTPYLPFDVEMIKENQNSVNDFINTLIDNGYTMQRKVPNKENNSKRLIINNIHKNHIISLLKNVIIPKHNIHFDTNQIVSFLENNNSKLLDYFDVAIIEGKSTKECNSLIKGETIHPVIRTSLNFDKKSNKIQIGKRAQIAGPTDTLTCLEGEGVKESAEQKYIKHCEQIGKEFKSESGFPVNTYFQFVESRTPLLLIYPIDFNIKEDSPKELKEFNNTLNQNDAIPIAFLIGFPNGGHEIMLDETYIVNASYNYYEIMSDEIGEDE